MKDPDGVANSVQEAAEESVDASAEDRDSLVEAKTELLEEAIREWFQYGEYARLEVDTVAMTCTVLKAGT